MIEKIIKLAETKWFILLIFCILYLLLEVITLTNGRPVICDEAWYTNSAYNFSQGIGIRNTNVGTGGDLNFVFPFIQGILFYIFGYSLFMARFASVLAGLFSIIILLQLLKQLKIPNHISVFSLIGILVIPIYHSVFRFARPESWAIVFVLLSLLFLSRYLETQKLKNCFFIGLFCGLGFLTHPYTLSISFFIGILFVINAIKKKEIKPLLIFSSIIALSFFIFFINATHLIGLERLHLIFDRTNSVENDFFQKIKSTMNLVINDYVFNKNAIYFIPLSSLLIFGLFQKKKNKSFFYSSLVGVLIFIFSIFIFTSSGFKVLMNYILIFSLLNISFLVFTYRNKALVASICLYFLLMLGANLYYDKEKYEQLNSTLEQVLNEYVPENKKVCGPIEFWMFMPAVQYVSTISYWNSGENIEELPHSFDFFLIFSGDKANQNSFYDLLNKTFIEFSGSKLIYNKYSKSYGTISLYSINHDNDILP
jgi:hypothetical protein